NTKPRLRARQAARASSSSARIFSPKTVTLPLVARSSPASRPSSVDLPEPEAPTIATVAPASTSKLRSSRIVSQPSASRTRRVRCSTTIAAGMNDKVLDQARRRWVSAAASLLTMATIAAPALATTGRDGAASRPQAAAAAARTLLVLGDSLSAEYGLARGAGWVALLEQRLAE